MTEAIAFGVTVFLCIIFAVWFHDVTEDIW
jgi:hypothetical protein